MRKRLVLIVILLVVGVILFLENVCKISIFENIKNTIVEQSKMSNNVSTNVKIIDVTGIVPGEETDHEHLYKTLYDENKHWEECMACGEKRNESVHSYTRTWASGRESCENTNYYTDTCLCGYSIIGHKACTWDGKSYTKLIISSVHIKKCNTCKLPIYYQYYYDGKLYTNEYSNEQCTYKGKIVNCANTGTCEKCGTVYTVNKHCINANVETGEIYCTECNKKFGKYSHNAINIEGVPAKYKIETNILFENGMKLANLIGMQAGGSPWEKNTQEIKEGAIGGTDVTLITEAEFKSTWKVKSETAIICDVSIAGETVRIKLPVYSDNLLSPDGVSPQIVNILTDNEETLTTWSKTKPIVISGMENYCDNVDVEIIDDEENIFFTGNVVVNNGSYSIACIPEIEAGIDGRKFKVIVTDTCNNKTEKKFEIAKVDAIAPRVTSSDEVGGDWAKSKRIIFSANDYGIGEVQIGFNSSDEYELAVQDGNNFSREYELFGDVYEPREANVYYKDGLGNISTKKIIIDKLDNTAPTITNVNVHNNKLTVEANDIHETWGEGSGIVKYRYIASNERIENVDNSLFTNEVSVEENIVIPNLPEVKYVYVVAEDLVRKCK